MAYVLKIRYLVPSSISLLSLYYAIMAILAPNLVLACWELLKCVVLDKLDGTSARLLKATSKFGMKLDSFVDAIAFGLVPGAILMKNKAALGSELWQIVAIICGIFYILGTFYRLYKFDKLASSDEPPDWFIGIPSTLAAGIFASYGVAFGRYLGSDNESGYVLLFITIALTILMNGDFPTLKIGKPENLVKLIAQIIFFLFISVAIILQKLPQVLFGISLAVLYISIYIGGKKFGKRKKKAEASR